MNYVRPLVGLVAVSSAAMFALPSQAAGIKHVLNFDDKYTTNTATNSCTPVWILTPAAPGDGNCQSVQAGESGNGALADNKYVSVPEAAGFTIDAKHKLTGTIWIQDHSLVNTGTPADLVGGQLGADITITVNKVALGTIKASGVVAPGSMLKVPVSLKIPVKLNKKTLKSVVADVKFTSGVGLVGISYAPGSQSSLTVPGLT